MEVLTLGTFVDLDIFPLASVCMSVTLCIEPHMPSVKSKTQHDKKFK